MLDLQLGIRPEQQLIPASQIAPDVLDLTQMIHQNVRENAMQTYIKYKAHYDKKANASKLTEADFFYVLQPKRIIKGAKFHLQNSVGLARTLLKKYYQITIIWYAKVGPTGRKYFIG